MSSLGVMVPVKYVLPVSKSNDSCKNIAITAFVRLRSSILLYMLLYLLVLWYKMFVYIYL